MAVGTYKGNHVSVFDNEQVVRKGERIDFAREVDVFTTEVRFLDGEYVLVDTEDVELD